MAVVSFRIIGGGEHASWPIDRLSNRIRSRTQTHAIMTSSSIAPNGLHVLAFAVIYFAIFPPFSFIVCTFLNI